MHVLIFSQLLIYMQYRVMPCHNCGTQWMCATILFQETGVNYISILSTSSENGHGY